MVDPEPRLYLARLRWAGSIIREIEQIIGTEIPKEYNTARKLLRLANSLRSTEEEGIAYLEDVFEQLIEFLSINLDNYPSLLEAWDGFFERARDRLNDPNLNIQSDIGSLKKMFKRPGGVVVTSCHSIKGEEYETVICYGLLKGYIPHWSSIYDRTIDADIEAQRLVYVIITRAKKNLHMISEFGRTTRTRTPLDTNINVENLICDYDVLEDYI